MHLPDEILQSAAKTNPARTIWTAICENDLRYKWPVGTHRAMGVQNLVKWVQRIVGTAGYPVRIQHWERDGERRLLAEALIWDSGDELEDEFSNAQEMPGFGTAILGRDGQNYLEGPAPTSAFERAIAMLVENPDTVAIVIKSALEAWESIRSPDELAMQRIEDGAAEAAANAVSNELANILRKSGYRVDESGDLHGPEDEDPDRFEMDVDDEEDETIEAVEEQHETIDVVEEQDEDEPDQTEEVEVLSERTEKLQLVAHQEAG